MQIENNIKKYSYKFFSNRNCEFFPCHKCSKKDIEEFNCLFCYCPLYKYEKCGGNFKYLNKYIKDCSECILPHKRNNYDYIIKKIQQFYGDVFSNL